LQWGVGSGSESIINNGNTNMILACIWCKKPISIDESDFESYEVCDECLEEMAKEQYEKKRMKKRLKYEDT
jgi:hypothetical protein